MLRAYLDGDVLAERVGDGPVGLIGLHGWGRAGADLATVLDGWSAIAPDLPGFGATPPPPEAWGAADYAGLVGRLIETTDEVEAPVVLLGHSFGGRVAVCLAAERPDLVRALVLTGVPLLRREGAGRSPFGFRLVKRLHALHLVGDARMERARQQYGSADYNAATGVMRETFVRVVNESYGDQLDAVRCPVALVWGEGDTAAPLWIAQEADRRLHDASLTVVAGGTHDSPLRAPATELRDALAALVGQQLP